MTAQDFLPIFTGYVIVLFVGLVGFTILLNIWRGRIDLDLLISEPNGDASLSRMQLLIFTFVISLTFFLIAVGGPNGPAFPQPIPPEVLTLLGISASSYLVSKGIQFTSPAGVGVLALTVSPSQTTVMAAGQPIALTASTVGGGQPQVTWAIVAPGMGTLQGASGLTVQYRPDPGAPVNTVVKVQASAPGYVPAEATITYV